MRFDKFISHVNPGEQKKNKYQYEQTEENYNNQLYEWYVFNSLYCKFLIHKPGINHKEGTPLTETKEYFLEWVEGFLNFHYSEYNGLKDDFLFFIQKAVDLSWYWAKEFNVHDKPMVDRFIARWIATKEEELKANAFQSTTKSKNSTTLVSYVWLNSVEKDIPELFNLMKGCYISNTTEFSNFQSIFTGRPVSEVIPIKWHEDNASELLFFIKQLEETSNVKPVSVRRWERLKGCFAKPDGSQFDANFKSLNQNIDTSLSQQKQNAIIDLVKNFT